MSRAELQPDDFGAFFEAVHGDPPFPWQRRLAVRVCARGWPSAIDLPTGAGKTAAIDIAVFHLALEACRGADRRACTRIVFVVDRRLVVDDAYARAERIAAALAERKTPVLAKMADALGALAESSARPLACTRLRGGMPREPDWVRTPTQPTVIVSTVDQAGSRLLFRGYGISQSMRPVHAGLLGQDALWLLDEAHLAQPLVQTIRSIASIDAKGRPAAAVTLSATPQEEAERLLDQEDRKSRLGERLQASKRAELVEVQGGDEGFEEACAEHAIRLQQGSGGTSSVVAIVVNRVATARHIFERIEKWFAASGAESGAEVALLVGRSRELDRALILERVLPRMRAKERESGRPLFVVATQTVEAGADLDFDALVTEIAPLDSLRQRFGRLNRVGRSASAPAVIVARDSQVAARAKPDPLYGDAVKRTWAWLYEASTVEGKGKSARRFVDFGIDSAEKWLPTGDALLQCLAPREDAPVLLPAFLERWARTSPTPIDDPEVSLFLHGPRSGPADVQIVWRADLDPRESEELCRERIAVCPPAPAEALSVPFHEARRWLAGQAVGDVGDLVAEPNEDDPPPGSHRKVFRWNGEADERTGWVDGSEIRPGELIVVPANAGGCDRWGWNPASVTPVVDCAEEANAENRRVEVLRLSKVRGPAEAGAAGEASEALDLDFEAWTELSDDEIRKQLDDWAGLPGQWREHLARGRVAIVRSRAKPGLPLALVVRGASRGEATTEDDSSSASSRRVSLAAHSDGVREFAVRFAERSGLPREVVDDIALAAFLHDAGKAEPSFQRWLYGGDELAAAAGEPLAKSGKLRLDREARRRAGLPPGARHEVASLDFAMAHPAFAKAIDPDLVLWLIGTHHGWGRPFFPAVEWPPPQTTFRADLGDGTVESKPALGAAERFGRWIELRERVQGRYGYWGLAWLEAILRLADHRRSELEQEER